MGFRFRKTIKAGPVNINLSKSGVGYSVGSKGLRVTKKAGGGVRATASIPGTGVSYSTNSRKSKANHSKSGSNVSSNGGCLKSFFFLVLVCLFIGFAANYWKILLAVAAIAAAAFIALKVYRWKHPTETEQLPHSDSADAAPNKSETELYRDHLIAQFNAELDSIPREAIAMTTAAPRKLLKDLPEYSFSNITKRTRLDSIFPLVVLDVETTGFAPSKCEILEVSAIKFESGMVPASAFTTLCKPNKPIPEDASAINHITDDMVADAPAFAQIAPALTEFIKGCHIAGHNLDFDLRFIHAHGADLPGNVRFYDTLDLAHLTIPNSSVFDYKLDTVCHYYGIWRNGAHRSLSDCYATAKLFTSLVLDKTGRQLAADADLIAETAAE